MVEAAVVLPLALFMVLAVIQTVMVVNASLVTGYAAYAAARASIVHPGRRDIPHLAARRVLQSALSTRQGLGAVVEVQERQTELFVRIRCPVPAVVAPRWFPLMWVRGACRLVPERLPRSGE